MKSLTNELGLRSTLTQCFFFSLLQNEIWKILMNFTGLKQALSVIWGFQHWNKMEPRYWPQGNLKREFGSLPKLLRWNPTGNWVILMFSGEKRYLWQSEKINFNFTGTDKAQVKFVMRKISFCENWSFRSLFSMTPIRTFSLELFHIPYLFE